MSKITGQVFKVYPSKFKKGSYQIRLEDNPVYYNTRKPGPAEPGVTVTFEAEAYNEKQWDIQGDVTVVKSSSGPAPVSAGGGGPRDASIQYQSARKDALVLLDLLLKNGALDLSKVKAPSKVGILEATLDKYTAQFYVDIGELGAIARLSTPDEDETPAAEPDEEE
jgi:hypothetical protein